MRLPVKLAQLAVVASMFLMTQTGLAATLIGMGGSGPTPDLAKSWTKVKDGEYKFELDTSKPLATQAGVKSALEDKLGADFSCKVSAVGAAAVDVTFSGDESAFLQKLSQTKIRAVDTTVALESSTSEGGIRAKKADRDPVQDEVKASVNKINGKIIVATVNGSKNGKVKNGEIVKVKGSIKNLKKGETVFFKPAKKDGDAWIPVAGSLQ